MPHEFYADCPHIGPEPQPVFAFIEQPDSVICWRCAMLGVGGRVSRDPDLCDYCKQPAPEGRFHELNVHLGPISFFGNVCRPCGEKGEVTGVVGGHPPDDWPFTLRPRHARGQEEATTP